MELLIRVVPKPGGNAESMPVGGVIAIMPDGHDWTPTELANPEWRIVRTPLRPDEATSLTAHARVNGTIVKRQLTLNAATAGSHLPAGRVVPMAAQALRAAFTVQI